MIALVLAMPAAAQRPYCDFGGGIEALRGAEAALARPVPGLVAGRETALGIAALLMHAGSTFVACGCPRLASLTEEAARLAEQAGYEASAARITQTFIQSAFRASLARQAMENMGCR